jgi:alpha-L-fucosidase 2
MNTALPLGNGRLGALFLGQPADEHLSLNEDSLWTGDTNPTGNDRTLGTYQLLADLHLTLPEHQPAENYQRSLALPAATGSVSYTLRGATFQREMFVSAPAQAIVIHLSADKPGGYTGTLELLDPRKGKTAMEGNRITVTGTLANGLKYETQLFATHTGGSLAIDGDALRFVRCDSLTFIIAAGTSYAMDFSKDYRGDDPHARISAQLDAAIKTPLDTLRSQHRADFEKLFNRVNLDLGPSTADQRVLPTDQRKLAAAISPDPELEATLFQFGRYLLISSSRPGSLPANLQGLWCHNLTPSWHSDYHANINVEMNYWPAESTNLSDCHTPLFNLIASQIPSWRKLTAESPDWETPAGQMTSRGFAIRTSHNIDGGMSYKWDATANAWYCHHLYDHFSFTQDKTYLRTVAYPIMKEVVNFWQDHLKTNDKGEVIVPNVWSPEHGPTEDGVAYGQEIIWDLFDNFVHAADALQADTQLRNTIASLREKLHVPGIGSWGQLLEWYDQKTDKYPQDRTLDTPQDHHRHTSHLFGLFPGHQFSPEKTPEIAKAAKVSLEARGDTGDVREWSFAWRTALWAHLYDGNRAHSQILQFFTAKNSCPNLFGLHPPMQIDGNFGMTGAIPEMLLQTDPDTDTLTLLPALPDAWPTGSVIGLRTPGGFTVDLAWKDKTLVAATLHSTPGTHAKLRYKDASATLRLAPNAAATFGARLMQRAN